MSVPVQRDDRGHFLPGVSGNRSGRPKVVAEIRELARSHAPLALSKVVALMDHPDPRVALVAAKEVLDRALGRPVQMAVDDSEAEARAKEIVQGLYLQAVEAVNRRSDPIDVTPQAADAENQPAADRQASSATDQSDDGW
jgi:hypothetical protein